MKRYDAAGHLRRQVHELQKIVGFMALVLEDAAHIQDTLREKITDEQPLTFSTSGVRFILASNSTHWRKLAAEYTERAQKSDEATR